MEGDWGNGVLLEKTYTRVREKRKARESQQVEIIDYSPEFTKTSSVWVDWEYFKLETDHQTTRPRKFCNLVGIF